MNRLPSGHAALIKIRGLDNLPWLISVAIGAARDEELLAGAAGVVRLGVKAGIDPRTVDFYALGGMDVLVSFFHQPKLKEPELAIQDGLSAIARARPMTLWIAHVDGAHAGIATRICNAGWRPWCLGAPNVALDADFRAAVKFWRTVAANVMVINDGIDSGQALPLRA